MLSSCYAATVIMLILASVQQMPMHHVLHILNIKQCGATFITIGSDTINICFSISGINTEAMLEMVQAKGAGYAMSRQGELEIMQQVAQATGVSLSLLPST